eukprot:3448150-Amphidinium_carterae.1
MAPLQLQVQPALLQPVYSQPMPGFGSPAMPLAFTQSGPCQVQQATYGHPAAAVPVMPEPNWVPRRGLNGDPPPRRDPTSPKGPHRRISWDPRRGIQSPNRSVP